MPVHPNHLHQTDSMRVHPLNIFLQLGDTVGDLESQPQQIPNFLESGDLGGHSPPRAGSLRHEA